MLQLAFTFAVYPSLVLAYMGQAAYLSKHHNLDNDYRIGFYVSVPGKLVIILTFSLRESNETCMKQCKVLPMFHCREGKMASSCNSNTCSSGGQSSDHHRHVFDHQTMFCFGLFSKGKDHSYVFENTRPDLHSPDQLDTNDIMFGCYHWV